jgi:hypothetical protein
MLILQWLVPLSLTLQYHLRGKIEILEIQPFVDRMDFSHAGG